MIIISATNLNGLSTKEKYQVIASHLNNKPMYMLNSKYINVQLPHYIET